MLLRNVFQRQVGILQIFPDICKDLPGHAADGFRSGASLHKLCKLLKDGFLQRVKITLPLGLHQPLREAGAGDIRIAERDFQEHTAGQLFEETDVHDIGDQFHEAFHGGGAALGNGAAVIFSLLGDCGIIAGA